MAADEIHVGDIGTTLVVTIKDGSTIVDLSSATTKKLEFQPPDGGVKLIKNASFTTDGTDGKIQYAFVSGDLSACGRWRYQGFVGIGSSYWHSDIGEFKVYDNLPG